MLNRRPEYDIAFCANLLEAPGLEGILLTWQDDREPACWSDVRTAEQWMGTPGPWTQLDQWMSEEVREELINHLRLGAPQEAPAVDAIVVINND